MIRLFSLVIGMALLGLGCGIWLDYQHPQEVCKECPEPIPRIDDHVAGVMAAECPPCPECPTYDTLKRAGVEIVCINAFGQVPSVNYWQQEVPMACSKIKEVKLAPHIKVIGGKK